MSAVFITRIPKIFVIKIAILQLESVKVSTEAYMYMMYIYSTLSLQCIIGQFSNIVVFGCVDVALIAGRAPDTCNFFSKSEKGNY